MVTLRCTQKLLRRVGVPAKIEASPPTTVLGDWYATLVHARPHQLVVCMNERTLLVVLVPAREISSLGTRFREAVTAQLRRLGVPPAAIEAEARAMSGLVIGPTASRSLLGCLREAVFALSLELERPEFSSLTDVEDWFSEHIYSTTKYRRPRKLARELFDAAGAVSGGATAARIH
jgi:hypothetical protein